ncbi:unnamed protein product [Rotaria sp. Silwood1]|nr:unnamed protein product [Rotaria sp. Silwood1]CAF1348413.1 unnamed protein product [Rotaria sp. Silwood1]CAF1349993.1 unnamed protein product [Rotaria sp. Silwood1]CAF3511801.1 unnamed protein product [Rotaria sp. Silwood1]CAF3533321.1 unnamed protein product [Rotaria sp. Silwood1]
MASSSSSSSSTAPTLIIPDDKSTSDTSDSRTSPTASVPPTTAISSSSATATKKLTKILSTQSSVDRHHPVHPIAKRFSIDADPSSIILSTPIADFSNHVAHQLSTPDAEETPSIHTSSPSIFGKETSPARSPSLKQSDSFLEIPYEKGEIVDLIKLADDPNAAAHVTNDGHEVLLEHGAVPQ